MLYLCLIYITKNGPLTLVAAQKGQESVLISPETL